MSSKLLRKSFTSGAIVASWFVVILGMLLIAIPAYALDPAKSVYQFNCQNWTHQNGLPSDGISAIGQTQDGYIWLGTHKGLVRFDGSEFHPFNSNSPQQQAPEIRTLATSKDGGIWFGTNNGGFGYFDGRNFSTINDERWNLPNLNSITIFEAHDGAVWTGSERGLGRWVKGKSSETFYDTDFGMVLSFMQDAQDRVWIGTVERGLFYWQNGRMNPFPDDTLKQHLIFAVAVDKDGQIWVGTEVGLRCYSANLKPKQIPALVDEVKALLVDSSGVVWMGTTGSGLARYQDGKLTYFKKENGLVSDIILDLLEDKEGSLWVGTQEGLSQLTDLKLPIYSKGEGLIAGSTRNVCASSKGGFWYSTSHGLGYFDGQTAVNYTNDGFLPNFWIRRVYEATNGDVYFVDGNKSLMVLSDGKITAQYTNSVWPTDIQEDKDGIIVSVASGLFRLRDGKLVPFTYADGKGPDFYWINNFRVAHDGSIWVASQNGIARIKDEKYELWSNTEIGTMPRTQWIGEDPDGTIWAGMRAGIGRIKDHQFKLVTPDNGLFGNGVTAIIPDNQGTFWVDSTHGIFRVTRSNLNDFFDGKATRVQCDGFEGAKSVKFSERTDQEPSGCKTTDGRIWFPSPMGVVMVNPTNLFTNQVAPPVYIQQIRVNGKEIVDRKVSGLKAGQGELEIHFSAVSFIAPAKVRVRYMLKGFDADWIDAGNRRLAEYTKLKPGEYDFQVQACNADGVWNIAGDSFAIEFPLHFYQTIWFQFACFGFMLAALFGGYRWMIHRAKEEQRKLREANDLLEANVARRTAELACINVTLREEIGQREKADQALAEQRNLLQTLIDNIPDRVFFKDTQSRVLLSNIPYAQGLNVATPQEAVGKSDWDFYPAAAAQKFIGDEQKLFQTGEAFVGEERVEHPGKMGVRWYLTTKVPVRDGNGRIIGLAGINNDITERKEWEAKQELLHAKLVEASRKAGMAEVATGVLHNVGNVLNSVNVSATIIAQKIRNSKSSKLGKVVELLQQQNGHLAQFLTENEKGKQLPEYLGSLAKQLETEKTALAGELQSLVDNIEHIKVIVSMQQANAKMAGVSEVVPVTALVEDALRINVAAFQRHEVALSREFAEVPPIMVDRHKVLQILINLLNNAKFACDESGRTDKQVTIRIARSGDNRVQISVIDNGVGILPENLARIFAHGFSTRKNGHGFGLHSGALAAMELGGKLTVHSAGHGEGASFFLELPIQVETTAAAA